jgi:hypothetical protein
MSLANPFTAGGGVHNLPRITPGPSIGRARVHGDVPSHRWFVLAGGSLLVAAAMMLVTVEEGHLFTTICAIGNLLLTGGVTWLALRRNPVSGTLIAAYLLPVAVQVALATLYFCYFNPTFFMYVGQEVVPILVMNWRFQLATSAYVAALGGVWLAGAPRLKGPRMSTAYRDWMEATNAVCMPAFGAFAFIVLSLFLLRLVNVTEESYGGYVVYGLFRYCLGLPMLCGATWRRRTWRDRGVIVGVLLSNAALNIVTNNRSFGFFPIVYFGFGVLLFSDVSVTKKLQSLAVVIGLFLAVMIVGDLGRQMKMDIWRGGMENFAERLDKLSQSTDKLMEGQGRQGVKIFARLFTFGGFQTTTYMPETVAYKPFSLPQYLLEVISQGFLPRAWATQLVVPVYEEKSSLIAFGYRLVHKRHSVERYCVGAAWEMGGFAAEVWIGMLTGFVLVVFARVLTLVYASSPQLAAVLLAVAIDRVTGSTTEGVPSMLHDIVYTLPVGFCIYMLIRILATVPPFRQSRSRGLHRVDTSARSVAIATPQ